MLGLLLCGFFCNGQVLPLRIVVLRPVTSQSIFRVRTYSLQSDNDDDENEFEFLSLRGFTPIQHLRPSSGREHTIV